MNLKTAKEIVSKYSASIKSDYSTAKAEGVAEYVGAKRFLEAAAYAEILVKACEKLRKYHTFIPDAEAFLQFEDALQNYKSKMGLSE